MSRASPNSQKTSNATTSRPSLVDALKKGVIDLHNFQKMEITEKRGSPFLIDTGVSFLAMETGEKEPRIYLFLAVIKNHEKAELVEKKIRNAIKTKDRWHIGKLKGAFWIMTNQSKKVFGTWIKKVHTLLGIVIVLGLIVYGNAHPEVLGLVAELLKYILAKIS